MGKSALACAVQRAAPVPFLQVQMDNFLEMLPQAMQDFSETFRCLPSDGLVRIKAGPLGPRLMRGLHQANTAFAAESNDLVFDTLMQKADADECRRLLAPYGVLFVGLFAPLSVIETREKGRDDRLIGLARTQLGDLNDGFSSDLELDFAEMTTGAAVRAVLDAAGL